MGVERSGRATHDLLHLAVEKQLLAKEATAMHGARLSRSLREGELAWNDAHAEWSAESDERVAHVRASVEQASTAEAIWVSAVVLTLRSRATVSESASLLSALRAALRPTPLLILSASTERSRRESASESQEVTRLGSATNALLRSSGDEGGGDAATVLLALSVDAVGTADDALRMFDAEWEQLLQLHLRHM